MTCKSTYKKAPTLETGWGFVLLLIVTFENLVINAFHMLDLPKYKRKII
jgi:hypothetical protein